MAYTAYEKLNVFDDSILSELNERRKSTNLVQTRTPFLRYTTTVDFGGETSPNLTNSIKYLGGNYGDVTFPDYNGCKFFTLGIHGWDNKNYSDMYNSQGNNGLIVGTTYKDGKQTLVKTFNKNTISPNAYPPPGIESATVERLRNGNVLKMTINVVCYTQAQLDMLDVLSFVPGMDCVLEWGNVISTSNNGQTGLQENKILNFASQNIVSTLKALKKKNSRVEFINEWCWPNDFNYDFALAQIVNVKTRIEDNKYKVTVIAYASADNIMYISAYATSNEVQIQNTVATSIHDYFAPNSNFLRELEEIITDGTKNSFFSGVTYFDEPVDAAKKELGANTAIATGQSNDFGNERTYYIRFDTFINHFINERLVSIVNRAARQPIQKLLSNVVPTTTPPDTNIPLSYNKHLKSTDPSILLIINKSADDDDKNTRSLVEPAVSASATATADKLTKLNDIRKTKYTEINQGKLKTSVTTISYTDYANESGTMLSSDGIWLNSKGIQQVFIGARTIMEGMETLLNKLNAATEGYWDLKLLFDEDDYSIRVVDDNCKYSVKKADTPIYTFNKALTSGGTDIKGPEVLSLKVDMDYPKLLFSQLAVSAINNVSAQPDVRGLDFHRNTTLGKDGKPLYGNKLKSLLDDDTMDQVPVSPETQNYAAAGGAIPIGIGTLFQENQGVTGVSKILDEAFKDRAGGMPTIVSGILSDAARTQTPIDESKAKDYANQLATITPPLNSKEFEALQNVFKLRTAAIIKKYKENEKTWFENLISTDTSLQKAPFANSATTMQGGGGVMVSTGEKVYLSTESKKISNSGGTIDQSKQTLLKNYQ